MLYIVVKHSIFNRKNNDKTRPEIMLFKSLRKGTTKYLLLQKKPEKENAE